MKFLNIKKIKESLGRLVSFEDYEFKNGEFKDNNFY